MSRQIDWSFPRQVLIAFAVIGGLASYPLAAYGTGEIIIGSLIGALISTVNVLLGYAAIEYSFHRSTTTFMKYVLGGMGIRLLLMALMLTALIKIFTVHVAALIVSMGIFYMVFLTLEVLFIQKKVTIKHQA